MYGVNDLVYWKSIRVRNRYINIYSEYTIFYIRIRGFITVGVLYVMQLCYDITLLRLHSNSVSMTSLGNV